MDDVVKTPAGAALGVAARSSNTLVQKLRSNLRFVLLGVVPAILLLIGLALYMSGGRYLATDNAYVGAHKVLITPDVSGKVDEVVVREGQHVKAGDPLFRIDPGPYRFALDQAEGKLSSTRTDFANLKSNYQSLSHLVGLAQQATNLKLKDVSRKTQLVAQHVDTQAALDNAQTTALAAELQLQLGQQQLANVLNQLHGNPDMPIEEYPPYQQAKATFDQAQRDLDHTLVRAPITGMSTQVDNIQLGRFVTAGTPTFSVIDDSAPWVDANPKETEITHLRAGQKVAIKVDSFPDRKFCGVVQSVSPGTGAQFSILPPQNANGNWVKVVQRVPVRIAFCDGQDVTLLRAGMSADVKIDTEHHRSLF